ncbi:MAG TPA: hypothetical protein PK573_10470 [Spirochaetota bacterium]|nr:hypothetical protein [Spirochaetota bacterium]HRZ27511.1 hypothetical protein [Spirochaetota bacterium]HSA15710.1 hypothetical protein [Spirochaetota bacterium]
MEAQSDLFIQQNSNSSGPAEGSVQSNVHPKKLTADPELMKMLVRYVQSFQDTGEEIEIKGRLIDFIRKI